MTVRCFGPFLSLCVLAIAAPTAAQDIGHATGRNVAEMTFAPIAGLPTCLTAALQAGDPASGPRIVLAKIATGCVIPWHWHTPNEHLMLVGGAARIEMKGGSPFTLKAGGFALLPSKHVHQFRCEEACLLYVYSDVAFDLHYVDAQGAEIPPATALAAVNETAATQPE